MQYVANRTEADDEDAGAVCWFSVFFLHKIPFSSWFFSRTIVE